jgi:hypothetical protein
MLHYDSSCCEWLNAVGPIKQNQAREIKLHYAYMRLLILISTNIIPLIVLRIGWNYLGAYILQKIPQHGVLKRAFQLGITAFTGSLGMAVGVGDVKNGGFILLMLLAVALGFGDENALTALWTFQVIFLPFEYWFFFSFVTTRLLDMGQKGLAIGKGKRIAHRKKMNSYILSHT